MKFLSWIFNINKRHGRDIRAYEKGKLSTKIITLIIMLVFFLGSIGLEYWCINLFKEGNVLVAFFVLLLVIALIGGTIDYCLVYSYVGFKTAIVGTLDKKLSNESEIIEKKHYRGFDVIIGFLGLILGIGVIVAAIFVFFKFFR